MSDRPILVHYTCDLRISDHVALTRAAEMGRPVVPVFVWAPDRNETWAPGAASRWYLHHSLRALQEDLRRQGSDLIVRRCASPERGLRALAEETSAEAVHASRSHVPKAREAESRMEAALSEVGAAYHTFGGGLLHDPDTIRTSSDGPYQVFTPFYRRFLDEVAVGSPLPEPELDRSAPARWPSGEDIDTLDLLPRVDWASGLRDTWTPGEQAAHRRLQHFIEHDLTSYHTRRDRPDVDGTSRLSPALHFGELSPRQIASAVRASRGELLDDGATSFFRELVWREFAYHVLYHFPHTPEQALRPKYDAFPWRERSEALVSWQRGRTGFPIVDAGMRQLWATGWMHNRVRMIVASFLTKDLLVHWREGARWFWDTLVDADLANNTMGWQWAAGSGADAQPYFRIFNPVSQGKKFDPDGLYVRTWVPELANVPVRHIHAPWEASQDVLRKAGVNLGETYPEPIVDHGRAREAALEAYETVRRNDA